MLYMSIIAKGWNDATFLYGLRHHKWVVIPSFIPKGLAQNMKMDHKKKLQKPPDYAAVAHVQM